MEMEELVGEEDDGGGSNIIILQFSLLCFIS